MSPVEKNYVGKPGWGASEPSENSFGEQAITANFPARSAGSPARFADVEKKLGTSSVVWLVKAYGTERVYSGNDDHKDDLAAVYRYTNFVPNHLQVKVGDHFILRGKRGLLGVARVGRIETADAEEERRRCPSCGTTNIKLRQKGHFACQRCNHKFREARVERVRCTRYTAKYEGAFAAIPGEPPLSDEAIRKASRPRFNAQNAIIPLQLSAIEADLRRVAPAPALDLLGVSPSSQKEAATRQELGSGELSPDEADTTSDEEAPYVPSSADGRVAVWRQIKARRGQQAFRDALRARYGDRCMVTGCQLMDVVEAAHIRPYRGKDDNNPANGLLLRADLHTLFDLDLIGIDPATLAVRVHPDARAVGYDQWDNGALLCDETQPDADALAHRWAAFRNKRSVRASVVSRRR